MLNNVLIAESSSTVSYYIQSEISKKLDLQILSANNFKSLQQYIDKYKDDILICLCDVSLNNTKEFEVVDYLLSFNIPVIVISDDANGNFLNQLSQRPVMDYFLRSKIDNFNIITNTINQIIKNKYTKALVVDDSATVRVLVKSLLKNIHLDVIDEEKPEEALKILEKNQDIKIIIINYEMEKMNGITFIKKVREKFPREELCIIGISSHTAPSLSADFLKNGANDFLYKPLKKREFINKVLLNLDLLLHIQGIQHSSNTDFMTKLYNRRYIAEAGQLLFENAKRGNISFVCAMIDIDHFKKINDTHGHDVGDKVIICLANELKKHFRKTDLIGRLGGEEFCVLLSNFNVNKVENKFECLRKNIEDLVINYTDKDGISQDVRLTISIGITLELQNSLNETMKFADSKLYEAKEYGRNLIVI